jgi:hypothetical protein
MAVRMNNSSDYIANTLSVIDAQIVIYSKDIFLNKQTRCGK